MFKELSRLIRDYAENQSTDSVKRYYNDIADALDDEEFLQTLSNTGVLNQLDYLLDNFDYYISNAGNHQNALNTIYTNYVIYRSEPKQAISNFLEKIKNFEKKLKKVKKA